MQKKNRQKYKSQKDSLFFDKIQKFLRFIWNECSFSNSVCTINPVDKKMLLNSAKIFKKKTLTKRILSKMNNKKYCKVQEKTLKFLFFDRISTFNGWKISNQNSLFVVLLKKNCCKTDAKVWIKLVYYTVLLVKRNDYIKLIH